MKGQTNFLDDEIPEALLDYNEDESESSLDRAYGGKLGAFLQKQALPYDVKVRYAIGVARAFKDKVENELGCNVHISVGGLDSLTLYLFLKKHVDENIKAISISSLEDKSIQRIHAKLGIEILKPYKSKTQVIEELGFPVISKAKAKKIELLQTRDCVKQTFIHAIMTGDMGEQGGYKHSNKIKLPDKWLKLFAGNYNEHRRDLNCGTANFKVSSDCCYWLKEKPADDWAKAHNSYPYLGLMAVEGGQREMGLIKNGCNYFGKDTIRSCPFAIFTRQDLLRLALELNVPIPEIYGTIESKPDGTLYTTMAQRTGCSMCGFGIHMEKRPHRFDRLKETNPKEWRYWMYNCVPEEWHYEDCEKQCKNGRVITYKKKIVTKSYGWGRVLDYIGIEWENPIGALKGQITIFDMCNNLKE